MNKDKLQQELKEKIKEGIKPSDLKKKPEGNITQPKNNIQTNEQLLTPPASPVLQPKKDIPLSDTLENKEIAELQKQVKFWSTTANTHLSNLQKATGQILNLEEEIKELKKIKPTKTQSELELALQETNEKIRKLHEQEEQWKEVINKSNTLISDKDQKLAQNEENIKKLQEQNKNLSKSIEELKNQGKNKEESKEKTIKSFFCDGCQQTKQGEYIKRKIDSPFEPRLHGRTCYLCSSCSPYLKELNETNFDKDNNPYKIY